MVYLLHRKDRLRLWDGDYRGRWNRLEWPGFCGSNHPSTVVSPSNEMFIRFKSNRDAVVASGYEIDLLGHEFGGIWSFQYFLCFKGKNSDSLRNFQQILCQFRTKNIDRMWIFYFAHVLMGPLAHRI